MLIVIAIAVALLAGLIFFKERNRAAAKVEQQRIEAVQRAEVERVERERAAAAQRERDALQAQALKAQEVERDALAQALRRFDDVVARWTDADRVAGSAARISLAQPVAVLQALHREAGQLQAPPCLVLGKDDLVVAMRETVDGYLAFMLNELKLGGEAARLHNAAAAPRFAKYRELRAACPVPG